MFADTFISQHLTDYIYLGGTPYLQEQLYAIANVLRALNRGIRELEAFYADLTPPVPHAPSTHSTQALKSPRSPLPKSPMIFPHFRTFELDDTAIDLVYLGRLVPEDRLKAVFKASIEQNGKSSLVVVKFTMTYGAEAHRIAHARGSAPKLWFCERVESVGMIVVVMDFVKGKQLHDDDILSGQDLQTVTDTINALHNAGMVYGDLRGPNIILSDDGEADKRAMLLDFDWADKEEQAFYPPHLNMGLSWHPGVQAGGPICREHDYHMLHLLKTGRRNLTDYLKYT